MEIEVHINVDRRITIEQAHAIGEKVQRAIEKLDEISRAFIHIDPLKKSLSRADGPPMRR